jgi:hypothetical protein
MLKCPRREDRQPCMLPRRLDHLPDGVDHDRGLVQVEMVTAP